MDTKGVVLGISGGIAAYKAVEVLRRLIDQGIRVQTVMTANAQEFIRPLTFQTLSARHVITGMFDAVHDMKVEHVSLREEYDLLLVAPATANILAKFAHGVADDFLSTLYLAWNNKVSLLAPSMNYEMYAHPAVQENMEILRKRGVCFVEPQKGYLACGTVGTGRLAEPASIVERTMQLLDAESTLAGVNILINAGPTVEDLDPIRFLSNRSSGKMGYALAADAVRRGARVVLVSGPVTLDPPYGVEKIAVRNAGEMHAAMKEQFSRSDVAILTAAVCDYAPRQKARNKIKKQDCPTLSLDLDATPDILAELGKEKGKRILVGFAAETEQPAAHAERKLKEKNADMIVANDVSGDQWGMESDFNQVSLFSPGEDRKDLPRATKKEIARQIMDELVSLWRKRKG